MTKIIVTATNKGGEGKTTASIHLAEYVSLIMGKKTLAIDLDPQANFSGRYVSMEYDPAYKGGKMPSIHPDYEPETDLDWDGRSSIANIFYGEDVIPYPTAISNMELLPSHSNKLQEAETIHKSEVLEKVHSQLKRFLDLPSIKREYEVIIIDTPPSKGPLTVAAIRAATHVIIPAQMEHFSIEGIYGMMQLWKQETYIRTKNNPIELVGILPNQVRDIKLHEQLYHALKQMEGIKEYLMPHKIKMRAIYAEMLSDNADPNSVFELSQKHIARQECEKAYQYIMEKVFKHG